MVNLSVNGQQRSFDGDPSMPLMWYLRDELGLTGTKFGCGVALCGACTVHVDGQAVRSCGVQMSDLGGKSIITIDGKQAVEGHIPKTQPFMFSADEGADVGEDAETNVSPDYKQGDNKFTGRIVKVTINTEASKLSDADKKKLEEAGEVAAVTEE